MDKDAKEEEEVQFDHTVIATYITIGLVSTFLITFFIGSCFIKVHKVLDSYIEGQQEPELALAKINDMRQAVSMREGSSLREAGSSPFTLG